MGPAIKDEAAKNSNLGGDAASGELFDSLRMEQKVDFEAIPALMTTGVNYSAKCRKTIDLTFSQ